MIFENLKRDKKNLFPYHSALLSHGKACNV